MSYKLGELPSPKASNSEIADYLEVQCLKNGAFSIEDYANVLGIIGPDEDDYPDSILDEVHSSLSDVLGVIDTRDIYSKGHYPFVADQYGISIKQDIGSYWVRMYRFLLFCTRHSMGDKRIVNGLDGAALFERLCAKVMSNYFGNHSKAFVFGTGSTEKNGFEDKVKSLLCSISEKGYEFRWPDDDSHSEKDDKIDIVTCIPFPDDRKGSFMAFGQCKTGTSWNTLIGQLMPEAFSEDFITPPFVLTPIPFYMVSESFFENWTHTARRARGLIFDRSRIMSYIPEGLDVDDERLYSEINIWCEGVKNLQNAFWEQ